MCVCVCGRDGLGVLGSGNGREKGLPTRSRRALEEAGAPPSAGPGHGPPLPKSKGGTTLRGQWIFGNRPSLGAGLGDLHRAPPGRISLCTPLSLAAISTHPEPDLGPQTSPLYLSAPHHQVQLLLLPRTRHRPRYLGCGLPKERGCWRTLPTVPQVVAPEQYPGPALQWKPPAPAFSCRTKPQKERTQEKNQHVTGIVEITLLTSPEPEPHYTLTGQQLA